MSNGLVSGRNTHQTRADPERAGPVMPDLTLPAKLCLRCSTVKPLSEFHKDKSRTDGLSFYCKLCNHASDARQKERDPQGFLARSARRSYKWTLRSKYGLGVEEYEDMVAAQGGLCAICKKPQTAVSKTGAVKAMPVDHNHKTGKLRGLLCDPCNIGLGAFGDDVAVLSAAIDYLMEHSE